MSLMDQLSITSPRGTYTSFVWYKGQCYVLHCSLNYFDTIPCLAKLLEDFWGVCGGSRASVFVLALCPIDKDVFEKSGQHMRAPCRSKGGIIKQKLPSFSVCVKIQSHWTTRRAPKQLDILFVPGPHHDPPLIFATSKDVCRVPAVCPPHHQISWYLFRLGNQWSVFTRSIPRVQ